MIELLKWAGWALAAAMGVGCGTFLACAFHLAKRNEEMEP